MDVCVIRCVCVSACARGDDAHGTSCIRARTPVGPGARVRADWRTHWHAHTHTQLEVLCAVRSGRGRKDSGATSYPQMFSHLSPSAARSVYVCARHPLKPTSALPPASRALRRAPSHPGPGPRCVTSREAQRRERGLVTLSEASSSLGPRVGSPYGTRSWGPPGVDILQPPEKAIANRRLLGLLVGTADWHRGSWQRVATGEAELDL